MPNQNGREIPRDEAEDLVEKGYDIKSRNDSLIRGIIIGASLSPEVRNFYASSFNGYVFDRRLVERFFPDANYLLVLQGASSDGIPTVLLTGCIDGDTEGSYKTLPIPQPASQHPPKQFIAEFPESMSEDEDKYQISFKLVK